MKVLLLCHHVPYPPSDGGKIAMFSMAKSLAEAGHEVHIFALNPSRNFVDPDKIDSDFKKRFHLQSISIDTGLKVSGVISTLINGKSYNISRFFREDIEKKLVSLVSSEQFDIIQFETIFCTPYIDAIKSACKSKIVLRAHNVENLIWKRLSEVETRLVKRRYLKILAGRLRKYENRLLAKMDGIVPISKVDEQWFKKSGFKGKVQTCPLGIDLTHYPFQPFAESKRKLFHLGSMDWMPNIEAIEWFLETCWSSIHSAFPDLKFHMAGKNFPAHLENPHLPNVICDGKVDKAIDYMEDKQFLIVPLKSGSGVRVKIIEGLALGKTIISTTVGAEGIEVENGKNILIANTPEQFLNAIEKVLQSNDFAKLLGENARRLAEEKYSLQSVGVLMSDFYKSLFHS